jgi:hypothetical protein
MFGITKRKMFTLAAVLGATTCPISRSAQAASITSKNSTVTFSSIGTITNWVVDGTDEFGGSPAGSDTIETLNSSLTPVPISSLTLQSSSASGNIATATYGESIAGDNFTIAVQYILTGGNAGSGASGINETITVDNLGPSVPAQVPVTIPVPIVIGDSFDANLNATPNNDTLTLSPSPIPSKAVQTDPTGVKLTYTTATTPFAGIITSNGSPVLGEGPATGNEAFSFVWDLVLAPGDTDIISNTISLSGQGSSAVGVPLPNSAGSALATLAGLGAVAIIRRKRAIA